LPHTNNALSVAITALRSDRLRPVVAEDHIAVLRLLWNRHKNLTSLHTRAMQTARIAATTSSANDTHLALSSACERSSQGLLPVCTRRGLNKETNLPERRDTKSGL